MSFTQTLSSTERLVALAKYVADIDNSELNEKKEDLKEKEQMFTVSSAGYNNGNYSEFSLGKTFFISKEKSKRGITVLSVNSTSHFNAWNFDFYKDYNKMATNSNFISLLRRLPSNSYFGISIKDDGNKNLFEGTKNFLNKIVGCKTIWKLNYRNSWCAIIYKKTEKTFDVLEESHNPYGVASVQFLLPELKEKEEPNEPKEIKETVETDLNTITQVKVEVNELKQLVLEQTTLIKQLLENNKT